MPVTYTIDSQAKLIRTTCSNPTKLEEVIDHFRTLSTDPAYVNDLDVLLDVTNAGIVPDSRQLSAVSMELGRLGGKLKFGTCAIIAGGDAIFGMMRMFEAFTRKHFREISVFREAQSAEEWLNSQRSMKNGDPKGSPSGGPEV